MTTLTLHRSDKSEPVVIRIEEPLSELNRAAPGGKASLPALAHTINYEADALATKLHESLPQSAGIRVMQRLMDLYFTRHL